MLTRLSESSEQHLPVQNWINHGMAETVGGCGKHVDDGRRLVGVVAVVSSDGIHESAQQLGHPLLWV